MLKKSNTMVTQPPHVQEEFDPELSAQEQITALNKLRRKASKRESKILSFANENEFDNSLLKRRLDPPNLRVMSLLPLLESVCENLRDNQSPENEVEQSVILMECILSRVESISVNGAYSEAIISKTSQFTSRIDSFLISKTGTVDSSAIKSRQNSSYAQFDDIPIELIELLRNPSIRALLSPPTPLEIEVKEMVAKTRKPPAMYPVGKGIAKPIPIDFFLNNYEKYFNAGSIYLDDLRLIDEGLVNALKSYDTNNSTSFSVVIKRERERADRIFRDLPDYLFNLIDRLGYIIRARKNQKIKMVK